MLYEPELMTSKVPATHAVAPSLSAVKDRVLNCGYGLLACRYAKRGQRAQQ